MTDKELRTKRTMLRAALLGMDAKGQLHRVATATGIAGGVETLKKMIDDETEICIMDIGIIGMHFGITIDV
jgi:hypothetical protein